MTITVEIDFCKENISDFGDLAKAAFEYSLAFGRELVRRIVEERDAELLRRVDEHHSLRAAAQSMEMAYSKAWTITKNAEEGLGFKLLVSSTGGKGGGGATLTGEAREFLEAYDRYCAKLRAYGDKLLEEEFAFYQRAN